MAKSNLRPPVIQDVPTSRAINELYKQVNSLLTSLSSGVKRYPSEALEGSVRAVHEGGDKYKIEGKTSNGWIGVTAQRQLKGESYINMPRITSSGVLNISNEISSNGPIKLNSAKDIELDSVGKILLNADGGQVKINDGTDSHFLFDCDATSFRIYDDTDEADWFDITVGASGATTIATTDDGDAVGHLRLKPDGDLILDPHSQKVIISPTDKLYFDGGGDTYIYEQGADYVRYIVGGDILMTMGEFGADGNTVEFRDASVGFLRDEATFSATGIIGSGGSDDTDIDFRFSNKFRLEMTADIHTMNLIFPPTSGNFLLVCTTDGDHDVTNWHVFESDESPATTANVMWAGGSVPAFTSSGVDIVSFYWDANEQQAYGTASLAFATP